MAPDDSLETVFRLRNNLLGLPAEPEERGTFDFVVAGGGVALINTIPAVEKLLDTDDADFKTGD